jgi:hypothetical protein
MIAYLQRAFRVLPDETGKLVALALLSALLQAGVAIGMTTTDSLFLAHLGAARLPVVFLSLPVVMMVYAPVYSILVAKIGIDRLVRWTLVLVVLGGGAIGLALQSVGATAPWLLYAMKLYVGLWFIGLYTLFWNFADDYFSILDGKRLYGLIAAGGAIGGTVGAALVTGLSHLLPPAHFFFLWAALALLAIPLIEIVRRRFPRIEVDDTAEDSASPGQLLRFVFRTFRHSRFAAALTAACFCAVNLAAILEFLSMGTLSRGQSAEDLAARLGELYATANVLTVIANLFVFNRLVTRIGVRNTALVMPLAFISVFSAFFLQPGMAAALLGFFTYQTLFTAIEYNNVNLLFNALPATTKRPLRTFVEALTEPAATALAGGLLLLWAERAGVTYVALGALLLAVVALLIAAVLRHGYAEVLTASLRRDWLDFGAAPEHWGRRLTPDDRARLRQTARSSRDRSERIAATDLLVYTGDAEAADALADLVSTARPSEADRLRPAIDRILQSADTATIARVLLWLESDRSPEDPELLDEFAAGGALPLRQLPQWRHSRHPARVAMAAVARWYGPRVEDTAHAVSEIRTLLAGEESSRRWGIRALGMFRHAPHTRALLPHLDEADAEIRLETLRALHRLASPETEPVLTRVLPMLLDGSPDERYLILGIAERVGSVSAVSRLLLASSHFSAAEARQLESHVVQLGPRAIATVLHVLRDGRNPMRVRTIAVRILARLSTAQLELIADELMFAELARARGFAVTADQLEPAPGEAPSDGVTVLRRFYADAATGSVGFVLEILGLTGHLPDVDLVQASLRFASPKDRANAIETIEQNCPRAVFTTLQPLLVRRDGRRATGRRETMDALLQRAGESEALIECAAAFLAGFERQCPGTRERLLARIAAAEPGRFSATLATLLPDSDPGSANPGPLHLVRRLAALARSAYLADASIAALEYLALRGTDLRAEAGRVLFGPRQPCGDVIVVVEGAIELLQASGRSRLVAGGTCNERTLMGATVRDEHAISEGCVVLAIPSAAVMRAIEIFPGLGLSLYRSKVVPANAP